MGIVNWLQSYGAKKEFHTASVVLSQYLTPEMSREDRRKVLSGVLDDLTTDTFNRKEIAKMIFKSNMIDMSEEICKQYENANSQVYGILEWLPRMAQHKDVLYREVYRHRKQYGLEV